MGASLRHYPQFEVTTLFPSLTESQELESLNPDVVLFDLEAAHPKIVFPLLESCPGLVIIGISPENNLVKMWIGQQIGELSTRGLLKMIDDQPE